MPRRLLTVQNPNNEQATSSIVTRSSTKRVSTTNESNAKKKTKITEEEKENEPHPQLQAESVSIESDSEESIHDDDNNESDYPKSFNNRGNYGDDHQLNKQYLITYNKNSPPTIISKTALYWSSKYRKVIRHVYPDTYNMFIHADFNCYGELEIVENCLLDLTKAIFVVQQRTADRTRNVLKATERVNYVLAFRRLEALTILLEYTDGISGIDDGERFYEIMRVIGACYVTILRGLLPKEIFQLLNQTDQELEKKLRKIAKKIPNFAQVLEKAMVIGYSFLQIADTFSAYTNVIRIVYCNWLFMMENRTIDLDSQPAKGKEELWAAMKQAVNIEKNGIDEGGPESFHFLNELQKYKRNHGGMGGDSHDIRKWSKADRAEYSFDREGGYRGFWFF